MNINDLITRLKQAKQANVLATSIGIIADKENFARTIEEIRSLMGVDRFDINLLEPLPDKNYIPIKETKRWLRSLYNSSRSGRRLGVIWQANLLRNDSANSLLKTLEEPPPNSFLLLLAESDSFLPTVRSRLQIFSIKESGSAVDLLQIPNDSSGIIKVAQEISSKKDIKKPLMQLLVRERALIRQGKGSVARARLIQKSLTTNLSGRNIKLLVESILLQP